MKKNVFLLVLAGFLAAHAYAKPITGRSERARNVPAVSMEQQLASHIAYPDVLKQTRQPGVVVIQFRINSDNELAQLKVFSQNEELNNDLLRQLTGRKLTGRIDDSKELYTVRLRFQP